MPPWLSLASVNSFSNKKIDYVSVLGVNHDKSLGFGGRAHCAKQGRVIDHVDAFERHEELVARDTLADERGQVCERIAVGEVTYDYMETHVDCWRLSVEALAFAVQCLRERLGIVLHTKMDYGSRASECRSGCP
jgi:hypothetical protein